MARSGPKPKSKKAQTRRGNPGKRAASPKKRATSPRKRKLPQTSDDSPPKWLGAVAVDHWKRLAPIIARRGLFTELDRDALTIYCDAWQQLYDSDAELRKQGEWIYLDSGIVQAHPAAAKRNKAIDRIRKVGEQLGLTPNSRRGLDVETQAVDPLTDFLAEK